MVWKAHAVAAILHWKTCVLKAEAFLRSDLFLLGQFKSDQSSRFVTLLKEQPGTKVASTQNLQPLTGWLLNLSLRAGEGRAGPGCKPGRVGGVGGPT